MKKIILLFLLLGLLGWKIYERISENKTKEQRPKQVGVPVEITPVQKTTMRDVRTFTGTLIAKFQFMVAPKLAGRLEKLLVNAGDEVRSGDRIALLDDAEYAQQVEQAQAELNVAKAFVEDKSSDMEVAKRDLARLQILRQQNIASKAEFDLAEAKYSAAEAQKKLALAQVQEREAALKSAEIRKAYAQIKAGWENKEEIRVVGERFVDEGAMLSANAPIVSILKIDYCLAIIYVIERDYAHIQKEQMATITTDAFPGKTFSGKVVRIAPLLKETSREARVEMEIANTDWLLKPGMFIRAQIEFAAHENVVTVPIISLSKRDKNQGIFLADLENKKAQFIPVRLGIVQGELAEILSPPISGYVVILGHHLLNDGSTILLPETKSGAKSLEKAKSRPNKGEKP